MNRSFEEQVSREHFVVRVEEISIDGIWGTHPYNQEMISFFALPHIISIHEEVELDPSDPEHAQMIKDYESKTGKKIVGDIKAKGITEPVKQKEPAKQNGLLNIIEKPSEATSEGDATFVDITSLENLVEQTKRGYKAYDEFKK